MIVLPADRLEWVEGWGESLGAAGYVWRPSTVAQVRVVLAEAERAKIPLVPRGAGCSYGDAAFRAESVVLDVGRMNRVLAWDPEAGEIDVEPGVTLRQLWRYVLGDGWWPPVVTGTMETTVGGCLAMNVHGKNNWARGTFGEHCVELDLMTVDGAVRTVSRDGDRELFNAVVGSFGLLGVITRARLKMKRVSSGMVEVKAVSAPNLETMLRLTDEAKDQWEYVVGWIDAFAKGRHLGRGLLHFARHLEPGEDPAPARSLQVGDQDLSEEIFGILPRSVMWRLIKPLCNKIDMSWVNRLKYLSGATVGEGAVYRQTFAEFSFLLDYVPNWKRIYRPGGLIQHQTFVPEAEAEGVFGKQLELCRRQGQPSFLGVLKRHRPDESLMGHGIDGFSLALDFPVVSRRRARLWDLVRLLAEPVVEAGGKFYPAKDCALPGELYRATFHDGQIQRLLEFKTKMDSQAMLRSALADRLLGTWS
ncbi:MAG: FAD-binding oxidoreductase [Thermoanaerobaculales bacterium]|nr:FAD-binding oxidoreductase [Thermoanaerobaculales bacterium]